MLRNSPNTNFLSFDFELENEFGHCNLLFAVFQTNNKQQTTTQKGSFDAASVMPFTFYWKSYSRLKKHTCSTCAGFPKNLIREIAVEGDPRFSFTNIYNKLPELQKFTTTEETLFHFSGFSFRVDVGFKSSSVSVIVCFVNLNSNLPR